MRVRDGLEVEGLANGKKLVVNYGADIRIEPKAEKQEQPPRVFVVYPPQMMFCTLFITVIWNLYCLIR